MSDDRKSHPRHHSLWRGGVSRALCCSLFLNAALPTAMARRPHSIVPEDNSEVKVHSLEDDEETAVIDIAKPDSDGVSLNIFKKFFTGGKVIVNNSPLRTRSTTLDREINGNGNLGSRGANRIVFVLPLEEAKYKLKKLKNHGPTSLFTHKHVKHKRMAVPNPANLSSTFEVLGIDGRGAGFEIFNPSGLVLRGTSYVNVLELTLASSAFTAQNGTETAGVDRNTLSTLLPTKGDPHPGIDASETDTANLRSRKIVFEAKTIVKGQLNIELGGNGTVGDYSESSLRTSASGDIQAGSLNIATVGQGSSSLNLGTTVASLLGDSVINIKGNMALDGEKARFLVEMGNLIATVRSLTLSNSAVLYTHDSLVLNGSLSSHGNVEVGAETGDIRVTGNLDNRGGSALASYRDLVVDGRLINDGKSMVSTEVGGITAGGLENSGNSTLVSSRDLVVDGRLINDGKSMISTKTGNMKVSAGLSNTNNSTLVSARSLQVDGGVVVSKNSTLKVGKYLIMKTPKAGTDFLVRSGSLVYSGDKVTLEVNGTVELEGEAVLMTRTGPMDIRTDRFRNLEASVLQSNGNIWLNGTFLENIGRNLGDKFYTSEFVKTGKKVDYYQVVDHGHDRVNVTLVTDISQISTNSTDAGLAISMDKIENRSGGLISMGEIGVKCGEFNNERNNFTVPVTYRTQTSWKYRHYILWGLIHSKTSYDNYITDYKRDEVFYSNTPSLVTARDIKINCSGDINQDVRRIHLETDPKNSMSRMEAADLLFIRAKGINNRGMLISNSDRMDILARGPIKNEGGMILSKRGGILKSEEKILNRALVNQFIVSERGRTVTFSEFVASGVIGFTQSDRISDGKNDDSSEPKEIIIDAPTIEESGSEFALGVNGVMKFIANSLTLKMEKVQKTIEFDESDDETTRRFVSDASDYYLSSITGEGNARVEMDVKDKAKIEGVSITGLDRVDIKAGKAEIGAAETWRLEESKYGDKTLVTKTEGNSKKTLSTRVLTEIKVREVKIESRETPEITASIKADEVTLTTEEGNILIRNAKHRSEESEEYKDESEFKAMSAGMLGGYLMAAPGVGLGVAVAAAIGGGFLAMDRRAVLERYYKPSQVDEKIVKSTIETKKLKMSAPKGKVDIISSEITYDEIEINTKSGSFSAKKSEDGTPPPSLEEIATKLNGGLTIGEDREDHSHPTVENLSWEQGFMEALGWGALVGVVARSICILLDAGVDAQDIMNELLSGFSGTSRWGYRLGSGQSGFYGWEGAGSSTYRSTYRSTYGSTYDSEDSQDREENEEEYEGDYGQEPSQWVTDPLGLDRSILELWRSGRQEVNRGVWVGDRDWNEQTREQRNFDFPIFGHYGWNPVYHNFWFSEGRQNPHHIQSYLLKTDHSSWKLWNEVRNLANDNDYRRETSREFWKSNRHWGEQSGEKQDSNALASSQGALNTMGYGSGLFDGRWSLQNPQQPFAISPLNVDYYSWELLSRLREGAAARNNLGLAGFQRDDFSAVLPWSMAGDFNQAFYGDPSQSAKSLEQICAFYGRSPDNICDGTTFLNQLIIANYWPPDNHRLVLGTPYVHVEYYGSLAPSEDSQSTPRFGFLGKMKVAGREIQDFTIHVLKWAGLRGLGALKGMTVQVLSRTVLSLGGAAVGHVICGPSCAAMGVTVGKTVFYANSISYGIQSVCRRGEEVLVTVVEIVKEGKGTGHYVSGKNVAEITTGAADIILGIRALHYEGIAAQKDISASWETWQETKLGEMRDLDGGWQEFTETSDGHSGIGEETVKFNENDLHHVFHNEKHEHNLEPFIKSCGGDEGLAYRKLTLAAEKYIEKNGYDPIKFMGKDENKGVPLEIDGFGADKITVRGNMVGDRFRLGTAFVNKDVKKK
ncbi:MAG: hypothetical protein LBU15_01460 [Rickettsiales bacterium]|jgi:hypothetical protein|nr:hypothetical protein [Rickettsiales bacterium]